MLRLRKILLCDYLYISIIIIVLSITIVRLVIPKQSNYNESTNTFIGIVEKIERKDDQIRLYIKNRETVIGTIYKDVDINLGDKIKITGEFKTPGSNTTNYLFNYKKYLERKNIFYLVKIKSIKRLKSNFNIYYYLKNKLINYLGKDPYLYTFLLGDKSLLKESVKRSYQENGISHLFAISGMHISLLVNIIKKLLEKLKLTEENLYKTTTIILLLYLFLVGLSPSILRGVLFYFLFTGNNIYYFYIKKTNLFLLILSISLLINPNYIFDVGFLYSYVISFSLLIFSKYLNSTSYLISLFKVSVLSFIVSLPITLCNFYQVNILSIFYNLFFVPFISIIVFPFSLIVLIIKPLRPIYKLLTSILENISLSIYKIRIGKLIFKRLPLIIYIIYFILIFLYLLKLKRKIIILFISLLLIHYVIPYFDESDYIKMIDVGQGDSILLHSDNKNILMDTGGITSYTKNLDGTIFYNTTLPLLKSEGIKKIDYLILSHGDKDHLGEAKTIVDNFKVEKILINNNRINYYEKQLLSKNTIMAEEGLTIKLKDFILIQLNEDLEDENDSSGIYLLKYKNRKILLTGDASIKSEELLLDKYDIGHIDILKVGHHGSKTSTSEKLLSETTPSLALISCGKDNKFKHPNKETIDKLNKYNVPYLRTDEKGTITINLNKNKIITEGER